MWQAAAGLLPGPNGRTTRNGKIVPPRVLKSDAPPRARAQSALADGARSRSRNPLCCWHSPEYERLDCDQLSSDDVGVAESCGADDAAVDYDYDYDYDYVAQTEFRGSVPGTLHPGMHLFADPR
ncbi:MAG: hypothetical protein ACKO2P_06660 [Planctomycetota bacterium]